MVDQSKPGHFCLKWWEDVPQGTVVAEHAEGQLSHSQLEAVPSCGKRMCVLRLKAGSHLTSPLLTSHLGDCLIRKRWLGFFSYVSNYPIAWGLLLPYLHALGPYLNSTVIILTAPLPYEARVTGTSFWEGFVLFTRLGNRSSHPVSCTGLVFPAHFWYYSATTAKNCLSLWAPSKQ